MAICCWLQCWNHTSVFGQTLCLTSLLPQGDVGMVGDAAVLSGRDAITQSRALSPSRFKNASSISLSPSTEEWCFCLRFGRLPSVALHVSPPESSAFWFFTVRTQCGNEDLFLVYPTMEPVMSDRKMLVICMSLLGPRGLLITGQDKSKLWKKEAFLWSQTGLSNISALNLFHIVTTIYRKEGKVSTHFSFYFY